MREIKFRAWDRFNERMVEPKNILKICMSRLNQEPYLIVYLKKWMNPNKEIKEIDKCYTNEFELMQYTGLKDRNGVEIFEGDILECKFSSERFVVEFDVKTAQFTTKSNWLWSILDRCEVIGNIHDNPELMGEKK